MNFNVNNFGLYYKLLYVCIIKFKNMEEKELNPIESLQLISKMVNTAKNKLADDGFLLIMWGWLVFIAASVNYISIKLNLPFGEYAWGLMPLGGIFSAIYGIKQSKKEKVKTYIDTYLGYLWGAFGIALVATLVFMPTHGIKTSYFFLMLLYGIATFISGGLLNFKPLVYGSLVSFACAIASVFLNETDQLMIISIAILCSYIIPGHMLRKTFKSQTNV